VYRDAALQWPNKAAIYSIDDDRSLTFLDLERKSNQLAHYLLAKGLRPGDVCALYMMNKPEFVVSWLAMCKIGVIGALINFQLRNKSLVHCVKVAKAKFLLFGIECVEGVAEVQADLKEFVPTERMASQGGLVDFCACCDLEVATSSDAAVDPTLTAGVKSSDTCFLVYTSGTTGLPKAGIIKHVKSYLAGHGFVKYFGIRHDDRIFTTLPLFHSAGGMIGVGMMATSGATLCLRQKFSARSFFEDANKCGATVCQYIGELCRYLTLTEPGEFDKNHSIRIFIGNGLRPDIWQGFVDRFGISEIGEFYGATEGNYAAFNHWFQGDERGRGAVGKTGYLYRKYQGNKVVKFDVVEEAPVRGPDGFLIECGPAEAGEMLAPIDNSDPIKAFPGYHDNAKATEGKILRDAFQKGDMYFRTGDLLRVDEMGYVYFVDRIGDTFRWHGENVSTTEVAEVVSQCPGVQEVNVVGVEVPGSDGRAPMAAMVADPKSIDVERLLAACRKDLPKYAVPLFLRFLPEVEITGTFKHRKVEYKKEGADPAKVADPLMYLHAKEGKYLPLTPEAWQAIISKKIAGF